MTLRTPAAERAYSHVRRSLLDGTHPGGTLLSEAALAEQLDISRTPVREALHRLEAEGFLRLYPKRGWLVVPVTLTEGRETMEARLLLELYALDRVAAMGLEKLRELGRALAPDADPSRPVRDDDFVDMGASFHNRLLAAAGNSVVQDMYARLWNQQLRLTAGSVADPDNAAEDVEEHGQIAAAMRDGDAARARRLLQEHAGGILRRLGLGGHDIRLPPPAN